MCEFRGPPRGLFTLDKRLMKSCVGTCLVLHETQVAQDPGQQVVEIMSDAAGHQSQRIHLLCLEEARRHALLVRDVHEDDKLAAALAQGCDMQMVGALDAAPHEGEVCVRTISHGCKSGEDLGPRCAENVPSRALKKSLGCRVDIDDASSTVQYQHRVGTGFEDVGACDGNEVQEAQTEQCKEQGKPAHGECEGCEVDMRHWGDPDDKEHVRGPGDDHGDQDSQGLAAICRGGPDNAADQYDESDEQECVLVDVPHVEQRSERRIDVQDVARDRRCRYDGAGPQEVVEVIEPRQDEDDAWFDGDKQRQANDAARRASCIAQGEGKPRYAETAADEGHLHPEQEGGEIRAAQQEQRDDNVRHDEHHQHRERPCPWRRLPVPCQPGYSGGEACRDDQRRRIWSHLDVHVPVPVFMCDISAAGRTPEPGFS